MSQVIIPFPNTKGFPDVVKCSISKVTYFFVPVNLCLELCFCTNISFKPFNNVWPCCPTDPCMYYVITRELLNFYCHQLVVLHLRPGLEGHIYSFNSSSPFDYWLRIFCRPCFLFSGFPSGSKYKKSQKRRRSTAKTSCTSLHLTSWWTGPSVPFAGDTSQVR